MGIQAKGGEEAGKTMVVVLFYTAGEPKPLLAPKELAPSSALNVSQPALGFILRSLLMSVLQTYKTVTHQCI